MPSYSLLVSCKVYSLGEDTSHTVLSRVLHHHAFMILVIANPRLIQVPKDGELVVDLAIVVSGEISAENLEGNVTHRAVLNLRLDGSEPDGGFIAVTELMNDTVSIEMLIQVSWAIAARLIARCFVWGHFGVEDGSTTSIHCGFVWRHLNSLDGLIHGGQIWSPRRYLTGGS